MYVCFTSFVSSPSTKALFVISVPFSKFLTLTWNSTFLICLASKLTSIPCVMSPDSCVPLIFKLFATYSVPSGISSTTVTVSGAVPSLLSNVIVYVIIP